MYAEWNHLCLCSALVLRGREGGSYSRPWSHANGKRKVLKDRLLVDRADWSRILECMCGFKLKARAIYRCVVCRGKRKSDR